MAFGPIGIVINALEEFTQDVSKAITLETAAGLIRNTPVKTGWARANWVPSVGSPYSSTTGSQQAVSVSVQQAGMARVASSKAGPYFVTNNVGYIARLNEGSSIQAPAGFVEAEVERARVRVEKRFSGRGK